MSEPRQLFPKHGSSCAVVLAIASLFVNGCAIGGRDADGARSPLIPSITLDLDEEGQSTGPDLPGSTEFDLVPAINTPPIVAEERSAEPRQREPVTSDPPTPDDESELPVAEIPDPDVPVTGHTHEGYPPARGCTLDNDGLENGQIRVCRFEATMAGTALATRNQPHPSAVVDRTFAKVTVTRSGYTHSWYVTGGYVYATPVGGGGFSGCAREVVIEAGDLVQAEIQQSKNGTDPAAVYLAAGADTGCD